MRSTWFTGAVHSYEILYTAMNIRMFLEPGSEHTNEIHLVAPTGFATWWAGTCGSP